MMYNSRDSFVARNCRENIYDGNGDHVLTFSSESSIMSSSIYSEERRMKDEKDMSSNPWD